jgi:hypothetical protein
MVSSNCAPPWSAAAWSPLCYRILMLEINDKSSCQAAALQGTGAQLHHHTRKTKQGEPVVQSDG